MRKEHILAVLLFGGIWGLSEAVLGGALYGAHVPYASVPLMVIGLVILTFARAYFPTVGMVTAIAACAMLYKFLNEPFFACHLFGILLTGVCYDLFFVALKMKNKAIAAATVVYISNGLFGLLMTFVFRYKYWTQPGLSKLSNHILVAGTATALLCALLVPLSYRLASRLKSNPSMAFSLKLRPAAGLLSLATAGLWVFGLSVFLFS